MIIWIASYPKSGNTWLRALISTYFFSKDGTFDDSLLKNIDQFPTIIRLGTNFDYKNFHIVADFGALSNQGQILGYSLRFGGEYKYLNNYYIRAGLGNRRMSVGVGLDWSLLREKDGRLDYAFVYENPAGAAHIFTYAFTF